MLAADQEQDRVEGELREVVNYLRRAEHAFAWTAEGRPLTVGLLTELHGQLVRGTPSQDRQAGWIRDIQVVIGGGQGGRVQDARFVPSLPGPDLERRLRDLLDWMAADHGRLLDPVVAAGMAHHQFETLHPFSDGNGRIGRLLVVLHLMRTRVLTEPTLTISPWFEARRADYEDRLAGVSAREDWDAWITFFADGLTDAARRGDRQLTDLLAVQADLKAMVRAAGLRAERALQLVDLALSQPIFSVRQVQRHLGVTYGRANALVGQLVAAGVLAQYDDAAYDRRFTAPDVLAVLLRRT